MKIAIYTSFAINYLAKARVLVETIKKNNPDIDVIACICDRYPESLNISNEIFNQIWTVEDYPASQLNGWIFKHNVMELSTAVKGWALVKLLDAGYDYVMYLDPDCWVLEDPAKIIKLLPEDCSIGVVPHTTKEADSDEEIRIVETSSLRHGIYNLGFLIVRNDLNGRRFAKWWEKRLDKYCIDDFSQGLFTDQRWFDLAVGYFDFIKVIRHHGIDVASWNIGQRVLKRKEHGYTVDGDDLIFYHFSGVGPAGVHRWVRDKFAPADPIAAELEFSYEDLIAACGQAQLENIQPYFNSYTDGTKIPSTHRVAYRNNPALAERYPNPFDVSISPSFRDEMQTETKPAKVKVEVIRPDLKDSDALVMRLFDAPFFQRQLHANSEVDTSVMWDTYKYNAWDRRELPCKFFNQEYYSLWVSPSDRQRYQTPLHHYVEIGSREGLSPNWIFNEAYYIDRYPDVRASVNSGDFLSGFEHFAKHGAAEGRDGCSFFNERRYLALNEDVAESVNRGDFASGEAHFLQFGRMEDRKF